MLVAGPGFGFAFGLMVGFSVTTAIGPGPGLAAGLTTGLAVAFVAGCGLSVRRTAWPSYMLTKGWLALRHRLPWSLKDFLADAHRRGVLRQAGPVYQFRHIELQHRLASRNTGKRKMDLSALPSAANRQPLALKRSATRFRASHDSSQGINVPPQPRPGQL